MYGIFDYTFTIKKLTMIIKKPAISWDPIWRMEISNSPRIVSSIFRQNHSLIETEKTTHFEIFEIRDPTR